MFTRYAVYYTPDGPFASRGAAWLGWDVARGCEVAHPAVGDLDVSTLTARPRKYGFHATVKAPFALAQGTDQAKLRSAIGQMCRRVRGVECGGLEVAALGRFLALVPTGDPSALRDMAADVVRGLDKFRAPASQEELTRRRKANLSPAQEANLVTWGYPHVFDQFRFHMTLTGPVPRGQVERVQDAVAQHFAPFLPTPFGIDSLTLAGERADGRFVEIERFALS